jgi:hypothetical protein
VIAPADRRAAVRARDRAVTRDARRRGRVSGGHIHPGVSGAALAPTAGP